MSLIAPGWATSLPLHFLSNFKSYNLFFPLFIYHILTFSTGIEAPGRRGEEDAFSPNVIHCPRMGFPVKELSEKYFKKNFALFARKTCCLLTFKTSFASMLRCIVKF